MVGFIHNVRLKELNIRKENKYVMEIIYRVYEIVEYEEKNWKDETIIIKDKIMLDQTICCCNSRKHFKEIMQEMYSPKKVHFANSRKLNDSDIYINIISENCYNTEQYFIVNDYECACCKKSFKSNEKLVHKFLNNWNLKMACKELYLEQEKELESMVFCTNSCRNKKTSDLLNEYKEYATQNDLLQDNFISKETFSKNADGYIYMITKKSTNEFYVGQSKYVPIFRWGQHLLTDRFKLENIEDYKFEVLEKVSDIKLINEREAYWINKKRNENPELSLNIMIPKEKQPNLFDIESE